MIHWNLPLLSIFFNCYIRETYFISVWQTTHTPLYFLLELFGIFGKCLILVNQAFIVYLGWYWYGMYIHFYISVVSSQESHYYLQIIAIVIPPQYFLSYCTSDVAYQLKNQTYNFTSVISSEFLITAVASYYLA